MDNDISPIGYSSPLAAYAPPQQKAAVDQEKNDTLAQLPLLKAVLRRLDKRIAETDSNQLTRQLAKKYELDGNNAMALQDIVRELLEKERSFIETRINRAKP